MMPDYRPAIERMLKRANEPSCLDNEVYLKGYRDALKEVLKLMNYLGGDWDAR